MQRAIRHGLVSVIWLLLGSLDSDILAVSVNEAAVQLYVRYTKSECIKRYNNLNMIFVNMSLVIEKRDSITVWYHRERPPGTVVRKLSDHLQIIIFTFRFKYTLSYMMRIDIQSYGYVVIIKIIKHIESKLSYAL